MEITNRIVYLLHKHVRQELDAEELTELKAWANRHPTFQQLLDEVSDEKSLTVALQAFDQVYGGDPAASIARMEGRIADGIQAVSEMPSEPIRPRRLRTWLPYAAAILIAATAVIYTFFGEQSNQTTTVVNLQLEDIAPGGNRARLTLADGRTIDLSEEQTGIVVGDGITYLDGSVILDTRYQMPDISDEKGSLTPDVSRLMSLSTPKGGTYQLALPDGSKVWLNAASTVKYPSHFNGDERVVQLEGEGYFEIAKDTERPFKVRSKGQEVEVLGTKFNVSAYADDADVRTTLVEGAVQIVNRQSSIINRLQPGEQSIVNGAASVINAVNTDLYTAWKDGFFYFDRLPTRAALTQLARWYDLELIYEGKLAKMNMFAYIERDKPLSSVLKSLEKSGLEFKVTQSGGQKQLIVLGEQQ